MTSVGKYDILAMVIIKTVDGSGKNPNHNNSPVFKLVNKISLYATKMKNTFLLVKSVGITMSMVVHRLGDRNIMVFNLLY